MPTSKKHIAQFAALAARFPAAFAVLSAQRHPLKIGIAEDIKAAAPEIQRWVLERYFHSIGYLRSMTSGTERVDLHGNPAGIVADEAAVLAAEYLAKGIAARRDRITRLAKAKAEAKIEAKAPKPTSKPLKPTPTPKPVPKPAFQMSLAGLREAAQRRRAMGG